MGNSILLFIVYNCLLVSSLLWVITFFASYAYNQREDLKRESQYECGFDTLNYNLPTYNINFIFSAIFLVLYDIELILLIPALFNYFFFQHALTVTFFIIFLAILICMLYDIECNVIHWYYV